MLRIIIIMLIRLKCDGYHCQLSARVPSKLITFLKPIARVLQVKFKRRGYVLELCSLYRTYVAVTRLLVFQNQTHCLLQSQAHLCGFQSLICFSLGPGGPHYYVLESVAPRVLSYYNCSQSRDPRFCLCLKYWCFWQDICRCWSKSNSSSSTMKITSDLSLR